jgi:hypothetical protein
MRCGREVKRLWESEATGLEIPESGTKNRKSGPYLNSRGPLIPGVKAECLVVIEFYRARRPRRILLNADRSFAMPAARQLSARIYRSGNLYAFP